MMRTCGRCGLQKPEGSFNWRRRDKGQRDNYCRACRSAYKREHYLRNKQRYIEDRNWQDVLDEISKCDVVCANCHRRRTAERAGFLRLSIADQLLD